MSSAKNAPFEDNWGPRYAHLPSARVRSEARRRGWGSVCVCVRARVSLSLLCVFVVFVSVYVCMQCNVM